MRYWLCPSFQAPIFRRRAFLRLYSLCVRHCNKQIRSDASPKSGILAESFPQLLALGSWWSKVELLRIPLPRTPVNRGVVRAF